MDQGTDVMIYSFGDIFARNEDDLPKDEPKYDFVLKDNSRVVSRANRFRVDFQRPARFGGQPGPNAPTLTDAALSISPFILGQAQITLCNPAGTPLYKIRAEGVVSGDPIPPPDDAIFFENPRSGRRLMKLESNGDLRVLGRVIEDPDL